MASVSEEHGAGESEGQFLRSVKEHDMPGCCWQWACLPNYIHLF
jgi:hypothetical protein